MAYRASVIAYAFVKRGIDEGSPITQMKLQKLVFFAHGLYLAQYGKPLIEENFQAWKFGPVVRDIYRVFRFYGSQPISDTEWLLSLGSLKDELSSLSNEIQEVIDMTWSNLKTVNASELSKWSHKKGSPWQKVYVEGVNDINIPNEEIENYFKRYLVN